MERSLKYHPYYKAEPRDPDQEIEGTLAKAGGMPQEIDVVVQTHLHWEHVGAVDKFSNAEFVVSRED